MRQLLIVATGVAGLLSAVATIAPAAPRDVEAALARLDMAQKDMVAQADVAKLAALSAPELTINAPTGRVLSREEFLAMMRDGRIGAEEFDRTIERVRVSGDTGVVMGSELFTPTAASELGRTYGTAPLRRRYTNIYQRHHGRWYWLARHANVVPAPPGRSP